MSATSACPPAERSHPTPSIPYRPTRFHAERGAELSWIQRLKRQGLVSTAVRVRPYPIAPTPLQHQSLAPHPHPPRPPQLASIGPMEHRAGYNGSGAYLVMVTDLVRRR